MSDVAADAGLREGWPGPGKAGAEEGKTQGSLDLVSVVGIYTDKLLLLVSCSIISVSCDPRDCSLPGSSVHGISQTRILQWAAMPSSRGSPHLGIEPVSLTSPALAGGFFPTVPQYLPANPGSRHDPPGTTWKLLVKFKSHPNFLSFNVLIHLAVPDVSWGMTETQE